MKHALMVCGAIAAISLILVLMKATGSENSSATSAFGLSGTTSDASVQPLLAQAGGREPAQAAAELTLLAHTSLHDTTVPGQLLVDSDGRLIVGDDSKAIMDYFLSLSGEMSNDDIRRIMVLWASEQAGAEVAQQFIALFDQYRVYLESISSGEFSADGDDAIRRNLQRRQQLRDEVFGPATAAALFAEEDAYDLFSAARMDIMRSNRDGNEKRQAIRALYQTLPSELAMQYEQQHQLMQLQQQEQALRDNGADDAAIYAHRQQQFGDMAAMRLQALDEQQRQWQSRLHQYQQARDQILSAALTSADQETQLEALRQSLFSAPEQLRVAALDRMRQDTP